MQEYARLLMRIGARFDIYFGGDLGGEGVIWGVHECDETFYQQVFQFGNRVE
jgi:hypothetical protein